MSPELIFLHIEKAAGTSVRGLFYDNYGTENVFWHDINDDSDKLKFPIVGGHRSMGFYRNDIPKLSSSPIFMGVLRDPIPRVISFYNHLRRYTDFFTKNPATSFKQAVFECVPFRNHIRSGQLVYLTGQANYANFSEHVKEKNYIIGTMDQLGIFTDTVITNLQLSTKELPKANIGEKDYKKKIDVDEETLAELKNLLEEDIKLFNHIINEHNGFYTNIPNSLWTKKAQVLKSLKTRNKSFEGSCHFLNLKALPKIIKPKQVFAANVLLTNNSDSVWTNEGGQINFSYHWYDENGSEVVVFEGARTPVANIKLLPGETMEGRMKIIAPQVEGKFTLKLVPMKSKLAWFDSFDFESTSIVIDVYETD